MAIPLCSQFYEERAEFIAPAARRKEIVKFVESELRCLWLQSGPSVFMINPRHFPRRSTNFYSKITYGQPKLIASIRSGIASRTA